MGRPKNFSRKGVLEEALPVFWRRGFADASLHELEVATGVNKSGLYSEFKDKEDLFTQSLTTVLKKHLVRVYEDVLFTPDDLPDYAARVFDFAMAHPDLMRLMAWFGLEQKADSPAERGAALHRKVAALMTAQDAGRVGTAFSPGFLLTAIMALATAWTAPNPYGTSLDPNAHKHLATLRRNIAEAVRLLSESKTTSRIA